MSIDPVERGLEQSFEAERWRRFIQDCQDIEQLRDMALTRPAAGAAEGPSAWMATRASESENAKLEMLASLIRQRSETSEESPGQGM